MSRLKGFKYLLVRTRDVVEQTGFISSAQYPSREKERVAGSALPVYGHTSSLTFFEMDEIVLNNISDEAVAFLQNEINLLQEELDELKGGV